jgi:hypothetical protein
MADRCDGKPKGKRDPEGEQSPREVVAKNWSRKDPLTSQHRAMLSDESRLSRIAHNLHQKRRPASL